MHKILSDIKTLRIQGAEAVARAGLTYLREVVLASTSKTSRDLYKEARIACAELLSLRPTEPMLYNTLHYALIEEPTGSVALYRAYLIARTSDILVEFNTHRRYIIDLGTATLRYPARIYTHCHSSTVTDIIIAAHRKGKKVSALNTETRPLFQGRKTATELATAGVHVRHYVDSAARLALKEADVMLIGCDSITPTRILNKIGSELICETAHQMGIPIYICTNSLKFDPRALHGLETPIESRDASEIWVKPPRHVTIVNPSFEQIHPELLTGIISELGVLKHTSFVKEVQREYPWITQQFRI